MHDLKIKKFYLCISVGHTFSPSVFLGNFKGVNIKGVFITEFRGSLRVICLISVRFFRVAILYFRVMFIIFIIGNSDSQQRKVAIFKVNGKHY